jgi:hypothetical protein
MPTDIRKLGLGSIALLVSSILIIGAGTLGVPIPDILAGVAALGLAAGALLVGLSEENATV